jgi:hypothetical protein
VRIVNMGDEQFGQCCIVQYFEFGGIDPAGKILIDINTRSTLRLSGLVVERHEIGDPGEFARMTDAELDASLRKDASALGLPENAIEQLIGLRDGAACSSRAHAAQELVFQPST